MARAGLIALSFSFGLSATSALAETQPPTDEIPAAAPVAAAMIVSPATTAANATTETPAAAAAPKPVPPAITLHAKVDLTNQRVTILEHDKVKFSWAISSGARGYETPTGSFKPGWMAKTWFSKQYDNAPMPHAVFFNGGIAMHATQATGSLGRAASHGCIRQSPANAATFYGLVSKHGLVHTRISVTGQPKFAPEAIASRQPQYQQRVAYGGGYNGGYYSGYNGYGYSAGGSVFYPPAHNRQVRVVQPIRYVQVRNRY
jgi:lipoprotein-anchoring transpeptidase ErfK/SrfK